MYYNIVQYGSIYKKEMGKSISTKDQENIAFLCQQGKTKNFVVKTLGFNHRTVSKYWNLDLSRKEMSSLAKKIYARQKKINFVDLKVLKNEITKDQRFLSNLHDPLKGCGGPALLKAAKEANEKSNYSMLIQEAIDTAEQIAILFKGQQELLGFKEQK